MYRLEGNSGTFWTPRIPMIMAALSPSPTWALHLARQPEVCLLTGKVKLSRCAASDLRLSQEELS